MLCILLHYNDAIQSVAPQAAVHAALDKESQIPPAGQPPDATCGTRFVLRALAFSIPSKLLFTNCLHYVSYAMCMAANKKSPLLAHGLCLKRRH